MSVNLNGTGVFEDMLGVHVKAKRIAVIGAGPAGLAVARVFLENGYQDITVYERNNEIGGVWCYTPDSPCHFNVPQDMAQHALQTGYDERSKSTGGFPTPLYDDLHTNLPIDVMQYPDFPFPQNTSDYPTGQQVQEYVRSYADKFNLRRVINLNTEVTKIRYHRDSKKWLVSIKNLANTEQLGSKNTDAIENTFDAVLICTGRVSHPYIPNVPGLAKLAHQRPGCIVSAKEYRRAEDYQGKHILVVGGAFSASDIARQLSYTAHTVHISMTPEDKENSQETTTKEATNQRPHPEIGIDGCNASNMPIKHPRIKCIDVNANLIHFTDNSTIAIPDHIIYATGYLHVYPFIDNAHSLDTLACNTSLINNARSDLLFTDGHGVDNLYKFLLYIYNPTLAVFGVPQKIAPFPFYEYQAYYLTQVFQGLVPLPSFKEMLKEWNSLQAEYPPGSKKVFELGMRQIDYRNDLIETVSKYADANDSPSGQRLKYVAPDSRWADRCFNTFVNRKKLLGY